MLEQLTWIPLSKRRENSCLILFYKIINNLAVVPHSCLEKADVRTRKKHSQKFRHIGYNNDPYGQSFFPNFFKIHPVPATYELNCPRISDGTSKWRRPWPKEARRLAYWRGILGTVRDQSRTWPTKPSCGLNWNMLLLFGTHSLRTISANWKLYREGQLDLSTTATGKLQVWAPCWMSWAGHC